MKNGLRIFNIFFNFCTGSFETLMNLLVGTVAVLLSISYIWFIDIRLIVYSSWTLRWHILFRTLWQYMVWKRITVIILIIDTNWLCHAKSGLKVIINIADRCLRWSASYSILLVLLVVIDCKNTFVVSALIPLLYIFILLAHHFLFEIILKINLHLLETLETFWLYVYWWH